MVLCGVWKTRWHNGWHAELKTVWAGFEPWSGSSYSFFEVFELEANLLFLNV